MVILIITKAKDVHTSYIVEKLEILGEKTSILQYSKFPQEVKISFYQKKGYYNLVFEFPNGKILFSKDIKSVYNRRQEEPKASSKLKNKKIVDYIVRESQDFLDALPKILDAFWVSNQDAIIKSSYKSYQLIQAQKIGFTTPMTLITNSNTQVRKFVEDNNIKDIAIKSLSSPGIIFGEGNKRIALSFYTKKIRADKLLELMNQVTNCPTIFQPYVEKEFELRITVVGNKVFSCAIHSQTTERTKHDWRKYDIPNTPHKIFQLPHSIKQKCVKLVKSLGLVFGCIDMIVTPKGEYVFLEVNPNGQWLWIEKLTGMPIGDAIVGMLRKGGV